MFCYKQYILLKDIDFEIDNNIPTTESLAGGLKRRLATFSATHV